jgi:tRNA pseudouridine55 synthase
VDGVLPIDKPAGITSHDVVAAVRRELRRQHADAPARSSASGEDARRLRVGHAGTLDPFASGLLLVLVGRATRVQRLLMALPKRYETVARLGAVSSTGDPEGEITQTGRLPPDPPPLPVGAVRQHPPAYSAVRVGGERAYRRARRGEDFEVPERTVFVHRFEQVWREGDRAGFVIECAAGTYVRSLIADLGDAYCESLRRTAIGPFTVGDAGPPPGGDAAGATLSGLIGLTEALSFLPALRLDGEPARRSAHGVAVSARAGRWQRPPAGADPVLLVDAAGAVAVAELRGEAEDAILQPRIGLRSL